MKFLLLISLFCSSAVAAPPHDVYKNFYRSPSHPGKCVINEVQLILSPGEEVQEPKGCGKIVCDDMIVTRFYRCGTSIPDVPGYTLGDYYKPDADYPVCCIRKVIPIY